MVSKRGANKEIRKTFLISIWIVFLISVIGLVVIVSALSEQGLESELGNLSSELVSEGYDWLVNYSVDYPSADIEVYLEDGDVVVAVIENVSQDGEYKVYLSGGNASGGGVGLGNLSYDVFDLKVVCSGNSDGNESECLGLEFDYIVDPYMDYSTYENVSEVYHGFLWDKNNIWMQVRSCDDAVCSGESFVGPDNTTGTWFKDFGFNRLNVTLTPKNQYFQYKAFLYRNVSGRINETFSPKLSNVTIGYYNSSDPYVESPNLTFNSAGDTLFNCTTRGYTMGSEVNVSFKWYLGDSLYKEEVLNSSSEGLLSSVVESPIYGKWFNCTVNAYDGNYSVNRTDRIFNRVYKSIFQLYAGFESFGNNIKMQVRSCDDAVCSDESFVGPDNTSASWFEISTFGNLSNITSNRYFQYFAYLSRNVSFDQDYSPVLYNVSIETNGIGIYNFWNCSTGERFDNVSCWSLGHVPLKQEDVVFNSTWTGDCDVTNNTMPQDLSSFTVESGYDGTIQFLPLFAVGDWTGRGDGTQLWNVTNNINISNGTMKIWGDYRLYDSYGVYGNITEDGHGQEWSAGGNITIGVGAVLDGVGLGFGVELGPGGSSVAGTYGGKGGDNNDLPYGSITQPIALGSGGENGGGGSAIKLNALDTLILNGVVTTVGGVGGDAGSGGSILLISDRFSGSGNITSDGGEGGSRGGGGGRVSINYLSSTFNGIVSVAGGLGTSSRHGQPGTLYEPNKFTSSENVIINSSYHYYFPNTTTNYVWNLTVENIPGTEEVYFSNGSLNITNLIVDNSTLRFDVDYSGDTGTDVFDMNSLFIDGEINVTDNSTLHLPAEGAYNLDGDLYIDSGSTLYALGNTTAINSDSGGSGGDPHGIGVTINVGGNATILGVISGNGLGFIDDSGPGTSGNAGSYGGRGGLSVVTYGSEIQPTALGSGGDDGRGGGAVMLNVTEILTINGNITMTGEDTSDETGSGGSIYLISSTFRGDGNIIARGGDVSNYEAGGGGRIAIYSDIINFSGIINNEGGDGPTDDGSGGTIYINATTSATISGNVSVAGKNGSTGGADWGQRINITGSLLTLSGIYNASALNTSDSSVVNGTITVTYDSCPVDLSGTFDPDYIDKGSVGCSGAASFSTCRSLTTANTTYYLEDNIVDNGLTGDCIIVSAENVTLDCLGYYISSEDNFTGVYSNQFNTTVKNCNISMGSGGDEEAIGIEMTDAADNSTVLNNTILGDMYYGIDFGGNSGNGPDYSLVQDNNVNLSGSGYGIYLRGSQYNDIIGNNITSNSSSAVYLYQSGVIYNSFINNTIISNSGKGIDSQWGQYNIFDSNTIISNSGTSMELYQPGNPNILRNNNITSNSGTALSLRWVYDSTIVSNNITSNSGNGVQCQACNRNVFLNNTMSGIYGIRYVNYDNTFQDCEISGSTADVSVSSANNTFINCSFDSETVNVDGELIRKWYYQAYVNDSDNNPVLNANVTARNELYGDITNDGLVLWMHMNNDSVYGENDTHVYDFSGEGNNGTFSVVSDVDSGATSSGRVKGGYSFDGDGDYINVTGLIASSNHTIMAWIKAEEGEDMSIIDCSSGRAYLKIEGNDGDMDYYDTTYRGSNFNVDDGNWHHVVVTVNNSESITFYLDGESNTVVASPNSIGGNCLIGSHFAGSGTYFNGSIDEVMIFNRSLSASEISELYTAGAGYFTDLTNSSGYIDRQVLTEYKNVGGTKYYYNNYSIDAVKSGFTTVVNEFNVSLQGGADDNNQVKDNLQFGAANASLADNCMSLNVAGTTYTLSDNVVQDGDADCMVFSAANVTLDCAGYSITSVFNVSGVYSDQFNTTVKNCNISMGSGANAGAIGIEMTDDADNSSVLNNTIVGGMAYGIDFGPGGNGADYSLVQDNYINVSTTGVATTGIYLKGSTDNILINNTAITLAEYGIYLMQSSNNRITNNTGISDSSHGIYFFTSSNNNILTNNAGISDSGSGISFATTSNNNILTSNTGISDSSYGIVFSGNSNNNTLTKDIGTSNSSRGIYLSQFSNNTLTNIQAIGYLAGSYGLYLFRGSGSNIFRDCVNVSGVVNDVYFSSAADGNPNNTFINCSYDSESVNDIDDELIRKWYYRAYVNDSDGNAVLGANVSAYNSSGEIEFFGLMSNSSGYTNITTITEYVNLGGTRNYYSNYTINASKGGYSDVSHLFNVSVEENELEDNLEFNASEGAGSVDYCGILNTAGQVYVLSENVSSTGTCFTVTAENVTIDCNGYEINYSYGGVVGYGVYSEEFNTSVKNCVIKEGVATTSSKNGVYFVSGADNGTVENNTITTIGLGSSGIFILYPNYNNINNNTLIISGTSARGIYFRYSGLGNNVNNNNITTSGSAGYGIYLNSDIDNNIFNNNVITTSGDAHGVSIQFGSNDNIFKNMNITTTHADAYGVQINDGKSNTTIIDSTINAVNNYDIYVDDDISADSFLRLLNVTFNKSDVVILNSNMELINQYYFDVNVSNTTGALDNALVNLSYNNGSEVYSLLTGAEGFVTQWNLTEYTQNWTGEENKTYVTPYIISGRKANYTGYDNSSVNFTDNQRLDLKMSSASDVQTCGELSDAGMTYSLSSNVSSLGICFNVTNENVTIDCNGYEINYSYGGVLGYGVYSEEFNTSVRDCVVKEGVATTGDKYGIRFYGGDNGTVENNTITTIGTSGKGIAFRNVNYSNINNNTIATSGQWAYGIFVRNSDNNIINNNIVTTSASYGRGIHIYSSSDNNNLNNNNVTISGGLAYGVIVDYDSFDNVFTNLNVLTTSATGSYGIYINKDKSNTTIIDSVINATSTSDIYVGDDIDAGSFLRLLNVTFNKSDVVILNSSFELINQYYFDVQVNSSTGVNIENANISVKYNNNSLFFNELSNSTGWIGQKNITEYTQNWTGEENKTYLTNYTIETLVSNYDFSNYSFNVTSSMIYEDVLLSSAYNRSTIGLSTSKIWVNYNEGVNLTIDIPNVNLGGVDLSSVWAEIFRPDSVWVNVSLEGNVAGGVWNATYSHPGDLGDYKVIFKANLTNGAELFGPVLSNFSVQNTSIGIVPVNVNVNTTDIVNVWGWINQTNNSESWAIEDNLFLIKLNDVAVTSDVYNDSNFVAGTSTNLNVSSVVQLNLSSGGDVEGYSDDFTSQKYLNDNYSSYDVGYDSVREAVFSINHMSGDIGNITYKFSSVTKFYNASIYAGTVTSTDDSGGNTSVWYSYDNVSWFNLDSSTSLGSLVGGNVPVEGNESIYLMIQSDKSGFQENPVVNLTINYSNYNYNSFGSFNSSSFNLPDVTWTVLKWAEDLNGGEVEIQLRESDDGSSWDAWSENYTNSLDNDISSFSKDYLQYRAWLTTGNLSRTPVLVEVNISYFNASTNSTGGYDYNITIPTDTLGVIPLEISVVSNPTTGIIGLNSTNVTVWARTNVSYSIEKNYSQDMSNYSVSVNFTRTDTGDFISGDINVSIKNSSDSSWSTSCSAVTQCVATWLVPNDLDSGNYTINITGSNVSGYYINSSNGFYDWLEEKNTTAESDMKDKVIGDLSFGIPYSFLHNFSVNNTGNGSMYDFYVWDANPNVDVTMETYTPCVRIYPNESCDYVLNITMEDTASAGTYEQTLRANWTDNDGGVSGNIAPYYLQEYMDIEVVSNAVMSLNMSEYNFSSQHEAISNFSFLIQSTGTSAISSITMSFVEGNISDGNNFSDSWINFIPPTIGSINPAQSSQVVANISIPAQTTSGNYSGQIKVLALAGGIEYINLSVNVLTNLSWYFSPTTNNSNNNSFPLNTPGEVGNWTVYNTGNVNLSFDVDYNPFPAPKKDYTLVSGLFSEDNDTYIPGLVLNPTKINVSKGGNTVIPVYQFGDDDSQDDVGIDITISNSSASPASDMVQDSWWIYQAPPEVSGMWFELDGVYGNIAEVNKNVTIKIRVIDDVSVNRTSDVTKINVTYGGTTSVLNASDMFGQVGEYQGGSSSTVILNFTANFTPSISGIHYVVATAYDNGGNKNTSSTFNFTSYATTTVALSQNVSNYSVTGIDKDTSQKFYINYTLNNTGGIYAYNPNITFSKNDSVINITPVNNIFGSMANGSKDSYVFEINVSELTPSGTYDITATSQWRNPDNTIGSDSEVFNVVVASNKSFSYSPSSLNMSVSSNGQNSSVLTINNTGNDVLTGMNLDCYTVGLCNDFTFSANESDFSIPMNSSKQINVTLIAPVGLTGGIYVGNINVSGSGVTELMGIQADVPETYTWTASPVAVTATKGTTQVGSLQTVQIQNTGNMVLAFNLSSTNDSIIQPNMTSIIVPVLSNGSFNINYSAPAFEGIFNETISITNASYIPTQINVSVNLTTTEINVTVLYPTAVNNISNVSAGDLIEVHANATYGDERIINNSNWTVTIGGSSCVNVSSNFSASLGYWNMTCNTPSINDGTTYNLTATVNHPVYGEVGRTSSNSIIYRDISPPSFDVTRNHVTPGGNINLQVNVTDSGGIDVVWFEMTYPNGSIYNWTNETATNMSLSGGDYVFSGLTLNDVGEYLVNYSANDSIGNLNSTLDWFEVTNKYNWFVKLLDYNNEGVGDVNVSLYRPNSIYLMNNVTNSSGEAVLNVNKRNYDLHAGISYDEIIVRDVNFTNLTENNISFNLYRMTGDTLAEVIPLHLTPHYGILSNSTGFENNDINAIFNYSGYSYLTYENLEVVKCADWNYSERVCESSWSILDSSRDTYKKQVTGNSTGFSAYFLAENSCGSYGCQPSLGETTSTCSADCQTAGTTTTVVSGGGGGGGGSSGLRSSDLERIENIVKSFLNVGGIKLETSSIYKELFAGETTTVRIRLKNTLSSPTSISLSAVGDIIPFIFFESSQVDLAANEERDVLVKIVAPKLVDQGNYDGDLVLTSGVEEGKIPTTIRILSPEGKLLDVKIQPLTPRVAPGEVLRLQTDLLNLGKTKKVDVQFDLQLLDVETGEIITRTEEAFAVETTISTIKNLTIPADIKTGRYMVKATAYYSNIEQSMQASSIAYVVVDYSLFAKKIFNIPIWMYLLAILAIALVVGAWFYGRWLQFRKKRFKTKVDMGKLPRASAHSGFIGKVAESGVRTFIDMNKLQTHTLIAGSTGSGKTVAAQGIIEEALLKKKGVIIFDPTAQWTGFLRKNRDKAMSKRYKYFNMKTGDAKAFNGSIKTITDPYELIDIKKYLNRPGEITIFNVSHLTPKQIDVVVASTIEQVFKAEPIESATLKTLIVYDEVHRLLPKFGGSGQGFIQLERGAREFRKWGIGLVLISQVLSDFVGEVKANIGTEVQMGTRYEGDLERVSMKYGEDVLKSVVKEPVGTGMVTNAEYNSGRPYFVAFRPLMHSTKRLTKTELKSYEKYFMETEDLDYQSAMLEKLGIDTLDLKLELKLAKQKVKSGQFRMAEMYLESLRPRFVENWKSLGKNPMHIVRKKISREVVSEGVLKAKVARKKYVAKNPKKVQSFEQDVLDLKKLIESKKREGKQTSKVEMKMEDLKKRLKPFKGKVSANDAAGLASEVAGLKKEIGRL